MRPIKGPRNEDGQDEPEDTNGNCERSEHEAAPIVAVLDPTVKKRENAEIN
jgi:hypothetical protein